MNPLTSVLIQYVSTQTNARAWEDKVISNTDQLSKLIQQELPQLNEYELESLIPFVADLIKPLFDQERIKGVRYIPDEFGGKYNARIELPNGSTPSLGTYTTVVEANAAMKAAAKVIDLLTGEKRLSVKTVTVEEPVKVQPTDSIARVCPETGKVLYRGATYDTFADALNTP